MIQCDKCGTANQETSSYCTKCGNRLRKEPEQRVCPSCKNPMPDDMIFCDRCGTKWEPKAIAQQSNTKRSIFYNKPKKKVKIWSIVGYVLLVYVVLYVIVFAINSAQ